MKHSPRTARAALGLMVGAFLSAAMPGFAQQPAPQQPPAQQRPAQQQQQQQRPPAQRPAQQPAQQQPAQQQQQRAQPDRAPQPLPPAGTIVVVADIIALLQNAQAAQSIRTQVERRRNDYQNEIQKQETELRNADQELARQRSVLSQDAYNQRRRELDSRIAAAQELVNKRRQALDTAFGEAMQKVNDAMLEIIGQIAVEQQYQVILPKTQVVVVQNALDITDEVMRRVNGRLRTVQVQFPAN